MSDVENEDCSPEDELLKRHRQEKKDLKARKEYLSLALNGNKSITFHRFVTILNELPHD